MTKRQFSFAGMSGSRDTENFEKEYTCIMDGDYEIIYLSDKTYEHREDGLNFDYKYGVRATYLYEATSEESDEYKILVEAYLIVAPKYLAKDKLNSVLECYGLEDSDEEISEEYLYEMQLSYGNAVILGQEVYEFDEDADLYDEALLLCGDACDACSFMDGMRGFYLDRAWNQIGTTGWDLIRENLGQIEDAFKTSLERLSR